MSCQTCGACCAAFRVDFHPSELAGGAFAWNAGVAHAMTVPVSTALVRMRGTDASPPRCVALEGEIGTHVRCTIYAQRPGPCREFEACSEIADNPACTRARKRHGLGPLMLKCAVSEAFGRAGRESITLQPDEGVRDQGSRSSCKRE